MRPSVVLGDDGLDVLQRGRMNHHWFDDTVDPASCHTCGLTFAEGRHYLLGSALPAVRPFPGLRRGLCALRDPHEGHEHHSTTLGRYWCTGDPLDREPERSQRLRRK